ncbi:cobalt ECF transporter T component CbiQ [Brevibacillus nitrificans]|uniref:cobalt ECF transporter T component CbiQ n=1 Tax=Brevibacillus nitrificans TaxID=651560 RepID=UPI00285E13E3|nr:cobalt ECF transporter T component CbiQ [Brevibacillus nitrificans]MDR7315711.1 cobalt/nickel transport system permease protein [Brevibacillus nitrificans]
MNWQQLDTLSYQNRLRDLSPEHKLLFGGVLLLLVLTGHALVQLLVFLWMGVWVIGYARIPVKAHLLFLILPLSFFIAGLPAILFDLTQNRTGATPADAVLSWEVGSYVIYVGQASVSRALELFYRVLGSLACFSFLLFTVPFAEILQVFRRIGMPELVTDLLMIMYRFIFALLDASFQLWVAQRSRGGHRGFRALLRDVGMVATQLFVRAMRKYQSLSMGMVARGYSDSFHVQSLRIHTRSTRYEWESILGCIALVLLECLTGGWRF